MVLLFLLLLPLYTAMQVTGGDGGTITTLLGVATSIVSGLVTAIVFLYGKIEKLDKSHDQLLQDNSQLRAEQVALRNELDRERQRSTEQQDQIVRLTESREIERRQHAEDKETSRTREEKLARELQRVRDELQIYRNAFERQGVKLAEPTRRESDRGAEVHP